ncbi:MAG: hypothetical protein GY899_16535 [Verrucomicrobiaceae bacterium]|nr:hypothetical protein [Verrucomicrobiaceae bacterium]
MKLFKIIVGGAIALGLLVELVIRLAFPVPMEPGATILLSNEIPGLKSSIRFEYDEDQLRKHHWSKGRQSDNLRVLCFGGNATTSIIQRSEDTWWGVLAGELEERTGKKVEVAALAHSKGGQILPALWKAESVLAKYDVDLVICCFGFGDAMGFYGDYSYDPGKLERMRDSKPSGFKYSLAKASHVLRIIRNGRTKKFLRSTHERFAEHNFLKKQLLLRRNYWANLPLREGIIRTMRKGDDPLREYIDGLRGFISLAKKSGAQLIVMEEPTIYAAEPSDHKDNLMAPIFFTSKPDSGDGYQVSSLAVAQELQRFFDAGRNECMNAGVLWLSSEAEPMPVSENYASETYLTDKGARALAFGIITPVLRAIDDREDL